MGTEVSISESRIARIASITVQVHDGTVGRFGGGQRRSVLLLRRSTYRKRIDAKSVAIESPAQESPSRDRPHSHVHRDSSSRYEHTIYVH